MVECLVWDQDAAGSNPVTSTKGSSFRTTLFLLLFYLKMLESGLNSEFARFCKIKLTKSKKRENKLKCSHFLVKVLSKVLSIFPMFIGEIRV